MATDWIELEKEKSQRDEIRKIVDNTYKRCYSCVHNWHHNRCGYYNKVFGFGKLIDTEGCPHYKNRTKIDELKRVYDGDFAKQCLIAAGVGWLFIMIFIISIVVKG